MGTNSASVPSTFPALAVPKPLALLAPPCLSHPAVTKQCPQLQQLRRAPGWPPGHGPLSGLLSSHLPPLGPNQVRWYLLTTGRDASGVGGETEARGRQERGHTGGWHCSPEETPCSIHYFKVIFFPSQELPCLSPCPWLDLSHSFSERCQQGCSPGCRERLLFGSPAESPDLEGFPP